MIKANELRIGNWVKHNDIISTSQYPGDVFQWSSAHWYDLERSHLSLASIEPIPLTTEILEKCGFQFGFGDAWLKTVVDSEDNVFELKRKGGWHFNELQLSNQPQNLHQLQNLYFALTGEELEYNPETAISERNDHNGPNKKS